MEPGSCLITAAALTFLFVCLFNERKTPASVMQKKGGGLVQAIKATMLPLRAGFLDCTEGRSKKHLETPCIFTR